MLRRQKLIALNWCGPCGIIHVLGSARLKHVVNPINMKLGQLCFDRAYFPLLTYAEIYGLRYQGTLSSSQEPAIGRSLRNLSLRRSAVCKD
jgi:hypothetical protein